MDDAQDVEVLSSFENGTHVVMTVTRSLDTGSDQDFVIKVNFTFELGWILTISDLSTQLDCLLAYLSWNVISTII